MRSLAVVPLSVVLLSWNKLQACFILLMRSQVRQLASFLLCVRHRRYVWAALGESCLLYDLFVIHVVKIHVSETLRSAVPSPSMGNRKNPSTSPAVQKHSD